MHRIKHLVQRSFQHYANARVIKLFHNSSCAFNLKFNIIFQRDVTNFFNYPLYISLI